MPKPVPMLNTYPSGTISPEELLQCAALWIKLPDFDYTDFVYPVISYSFIYITNEEENIAMIAEGNKIIEQIHGIINEVKPGDRIIFESLLSIVPANPINTKSPATIFTGLEISQREGL